MRRYLGNCWLSVGETAHALGLPVEATELLLRRGRLNVLWLGDGMYAERGQVEQLALRFGVLDAAFAEWPPLDRVI